jgi:hypothetical protein
VSRSELILKVFIASPSDVTDERESLESVIQEINKVWSGQLGLRLELERWEANARPGFGTDAQAVLNSQINRDCDVFIAIFWGRLGTPTPRATSGTVEEFQRALARHRASPGSVELLIYFKDAPIAPSKLDPVQLQRLAEFKREVEKIGGLHWTFETTADFESTARSHLGALVQAWAARSRSGRSTDSVQRSPEPVESESPKLDDSDEYGFLDHLETFDAKNSDMCAALRYMAEATERIKLRFSERAQSLNGLGELTEKGNLRDAKKAITLLSDDLHSYAAVLEQQLPLFTGSSKASLEAVSRALVVYKDFKKGDDANLVTLAQTFGEMREAGIGAAEGLNGFKSMLAGLPRVTIEFNKARRRVIRGLEGVLSGIQSHATTTANILQAVDELRSASN